MTNSTDVPCEHSGLQLLDGNYKKGLRDLSSKTTPMCLPPASRMSPLVTNLPGLPPPYMHTASKQRRLEVGTACMGIRLWTSCTVYNLIAKISPKKWKGFRDGCHTPPLKKSKEIRGKCHCPASVPSHLKGNGIGCDWGCVMAFPLVSLLLWEMEYDRPSLNPFSFLEILFWFLFKWQPHSW